VSTGSAVLSAALIGLASGAEADLLAYLMSRYFGLAHYGKLYGLQYSVFGLASGLSPFVFGRIFDVTHSYEIALYSAGVLFVLGAAVLLTLGRYPTFAARETGGA
jgi:MFS family permease